MHGQEKLTDGKAFVVGILEKMAAGLEKMTLFVVSTCQVSVSYCLFMPSAFQLFQSACKVAASVCKFFASAALFLTAVCNIGASQALTAVSKG